MMLKIYTVHAEFDEIQLSIFKDTKNNVSCLPNGRGYSDIVTLHFYTFLQNKQLPTAVNTCTQNICYWICHNNQINHCNGNRNVHHGESI